MAPTQKITKSTKNIKNTGWNAFLAHFRGQNKGMAADDVIMANAGEAWGKLSDEQKKAANATNWVRFLAEFRLKNKGKMAAAEVMVNGGQAWKKLTDAQKAAYGPTFGPKK